MSHLLFFSPIANSLREGPYGVDSCRVREGVAANDQIHN